MTEVLRTVEALRVRVDNWKRDGATIGVVPTMGALHEGHLGLVDAALRDCDRVVVTIFVNPAQFDDPRDLEKYPRHESGDVELLTPTGVHAVFIPPVVEVYPSGFASRVRVTGLAERLEGLHRPGHFDGVATVITKLFGMTRADRAYFGEKDWQQLQVVRRVAADLDLRVTVVGCPTIREADGLARSSRNARLSPGGRAAASALPRVMQTAAGQLREGLDAAGALSEGRRALLAAGFERVEYLDLCDADTLEWRERATQRSRLFAAAWIGGVRLIDNIVV